MKNGNATYRCTARVLLLVMLLPAFGPLAVARMAQPEGMHCVRRPLSPAAAGAAASMPCHHGAMQAPGDDTASSQSSEASFHSRDCCCDHDCCRSVRTSEWAQPASRLRSVSLLINPAPTPAAAIRAAAFVAGFDSARAPPRS